MADDLDKKMEPEITDAAEVAAEAEKTASVVEAVEAKAEEAAIAEAKAAEKAAAEAEKAAENAAIDAEKTAEKAAKKAEEQAAKEAAKKQAAIDKEAEKARIASEKANAKIEKKNKKRLAQQALIDACPPQYRPVSTSMYFWLGFLSFLPGIGLIVTVILSICGRNKNVKNFERAILAYYIIALIICLILLIIIGLVLPPDTRSNVLMAFSKMFSSIKVG